MSETPQENGAETKQKQKEPQFVPSEFMTVTQGLPFVQYNKYPKEFYDSLKQVNFDSAPKFNGKSLLKSLNDLTREFDTIDLDKLLNEPSELITKFIEYGKQQFHPEEYRFLIYYAPPAVISEDTKTFLFFLVKIVHQVKDPCKLMAWLSYTMFPQSFTHQSKKEILAISRCKQGKKTNLWAVYTSPNSFTLYEFKGTNEPEAKLKSNANKFVIGKDKTSIDVYNDDKLVTNFTPEDSNQLQLYESLSNGPVPLVYFLTGFDTPAVDQIYATAFDEITNSDAKILQVLMLPTISSPDDKISSQILKAFLDLFTYANKFIPFINSIISSEFNDPKEDIMKIIHQPTHTVNLISTIFNQYGKTYSETFIKKLSDYIISTGGCKITSRTPDVPALERVINTVCKYIVGSVELVPPVIRQVLYVLRSFLNTRTNCCANIYLILSYVFFECYLLPALKHYSETDQENKNMMSRFVYIFNYIFKLSSMEGNLKFLSSIQKRLDKHIYPNLMQFIFAISEAPEESTVSYSTISAEKVARSIETILKAISAKASDFCNAFQDNAKSKSQKPTILGTVFSSLLTTFFHYQFDVGPVAEEDKPPRSPKKVIKKLVKYQNDNVPESMNNVVHKIVRLSELDEENIDPSKPRKYYKRVVKKAPMEGN